MSEKRIERMGEIETQIRLETRSGELISYVRIPTMYVAPEVLVWREFTFINVMRLSEERFPIYAKVVSVTIEDPTSHDEPFKPYMP